MVKNITKWIVGIVIIAVIIIEVVLIFIPKETKVIKIGVILPLSGKAASFGEDGQKAIDLAKENINKKEEIIKVIYEDEKCDPKEAVTAYKTLTLKGAKIIIGAFCSSSTLAIAPLAEQEKVVLITPASSADTITQAGDFIFRNHVFASQKEGKLGEFAAQKFNTIATIYDQSMEAYVLGEQFLVEKFQEGGGEILIRESFSAGATDFKTELIKIKEKNPEAIFIGSLMPQSILIVKQITELGINAKIISDDALVIDKKFLDGAGNLSEGIIFSGSEFNRETNPEFWDLYTERFGKNPTIWAAQSYDSLMILAKIIQEKCKGGSSVCVKDELYKIKNYPGVSGLTTFDENGDAQKPVVIKEIRDGKFVTIS